MSNLVLKADFIVGTNIESACKEAILLARRLDCCIEFKFNHIPMFAHPLSTLEKMMKDWLFFIFISGEKNRL